MLLHTHLDVEMMPTQRAGHATEIGQTLELGKYDAVVTASGDGLLHELMNGLMAHERWQEAIKTVIGVIPFGSGNGLAASVGSWSLCLDRCLPMISMTVSAAACCAEPGQNASPANGYVCCAARGTGGSVRVPAVCLGRVLRN